ncbi:MAG: hypothetical protein HY341_02770 [Candidatus Kerfeldbacteria bacterium]|nr:hypothetical protein [Candidatus Kerfeldbacteria bacterium]
MILPAILTDDPAELRRQLQTLSALSPWIHVDIMDGLFVPQRSVDPAALADIPLGVQLELHLMVRNPLSALEASHQPSVGRVLIHHEALAEYDRPRDVITRFPVPVGVALNPGTPLDAAELYTPTADTIVLMGVTPGRQGQSMDPATVERVADAFRRFPACPITVDGGVNADTLLALRNAGAKRFVVGSAIIGAPDPAGTYRQLAHQLRETSP